MCRSKKVTLYKYDMNGHGKYKLYQCSALQLQKGVFSFEKIPDNLKKIFGHGTRVPVKNLLNAGINTDRLKAIAFFIENNQSAISFIQKHLQCTLLEHARAEELFEQLKKEK